MNPSAHAPSVRLAVAGCASLGLLAWIGFARDSTPSLLSSNDDHPLGMAVTAVFAFLILLALAPIWGRGPARARGLALLLSLFPGLALGFVGLAAMRHVSQINIDATGTTRLGPVPIRDTNVRNAALSAMSHLNGGAASVTTAKAAPLSNLVETVQAMKRAGITSVTLRTELSPSERQGSVSNSSPTSRHGAR